MALPSLAVCVHPSPMGELGLRAAGQKDLSPQAELLLCSSGPFPEEAGQGGWASATFHHPMTSCALSNPCLPLNVLDVLEFHTGLWSLQDFVVQNPCCI